MISFWSRGSFYNTEKFLHAMKRLNIKSILESCGRKGVSALNSVTPVETGLAAGSWGYEVKQRGQVYEVIWTNSDREDGFPVAIMLQYGYGTGTGGYVQGRDYINPVIQPIFDEIEVEVWKVVTSA